MIALFGGLLGQIAVPHGKTYMAEMCEGSTILAIDLGRMAPLETIRAEVQQMMRYVQNTPPMEGSSGVVFPGERSAKSRQERLAQGIPVDPTTWAQVEALFDPYGVRDQLADVLPSRGHP